jgi:hypothetical protein
MGENATSAPTRAKPHETPIVVAKRVRCPRCRGTELKRTRTLDSGPDIVSRRMSCKCGCRFIVIFD